MFWDEQGHIQHVWKVIQYLLSNILFDTAENCEFHKWTISFLVWVQSQAANCSAQQKKWLFCSQHQQWITLHSWKALDGWTLYHERALSIKISAIVKCFCLKHNELHNGTMLARQDSHCCFTHFNSWLQEQEQEVSSSGSSEYSS